jgi:hypothetical protein
MRNRQTLKTRQPGFRPTVFLVFGAFSRKLLPILTKIEDFVTFAEHKMAVPKHKKGEKLTLTDIKFGKSGKQPPLKRMLTTPPIFFLPIMYNVFRTDVQ